MQPISIEFKCIFPEQLELYTKMIDTPEGKMNVPEHGFKFVPGKWWPVRIDQEDGSVSDETKTNDRSQRQGNHLRAVS